MKTIHTVYSAGIRTDHMGSISRAMSTSGHEKKNRHGHIRAYMRAEKVDQKDSDDDVLQWFESWCVVKPHEEKCADDEI